MLVVSRRVHERIVFVNVSDQPVVIPPGAVVCDVTVVEIHRDPVRGGGRARLGFEEGPEEIRALRQEVHLKKLTERTAENEVAES